MSNDAKISQFRNAIETKRAELGDKPKLAYTTNALLELDGTKFNLNTLNSEEQCVMVASRILFITQGIEQANILLGTKVIAKFGDFTAQQWLSDLKLRVQLLVWENKRKKLSAMDEQLKTLLSEDAKTADAIANIASQLAE